MTPIASIRVLLRRLAAGLLPLLCACAQGSADDQVWLRIRNDSGVVFEHVWQGHPVRGTDFDFGRLKPGQLSDWHAFPAQLPHYRKTAVQFEGGAQLIDVTDKAYPGGKPVLEPGRYTFAYTLVDGRLRLRVIAENASPR